MDNTYKIVTTSCEDTKNICIIGPSGAGKSTLANKFLNRSNFATSDKLDKSCTKSVQSDLLRTDRKQYSIIDTPGFFDTNDANDMLTISKITNELSKFQTINLFVWCISTNYDRFEKKLTQILEVFALIYGNQFCKNLCIVVTKNAKSPREYEHFVQQFKNALQNGNISFREAYYFSRDDFLNDNCQFINNILDIAGETDPLACMDVQNTWQLFKEQQKKIDQLKDEVKVLKLQKEDYICKLHQILGAF